MKELQIEYTPANLTAICGLPASMIVMDYKEIVAAINEIRDEASKPETEER